MSLTRRLVIALIAAVVLVAGVIVAAIVVTPPQVDGVSSPSVSSSGTPRLTSRPTPSASPTPTPTPSPTPRVTATPLRSATPSARPSAASGESIERIISSMSAEEKAGQLLIVSLLGPTVTPEVSTAVANGVGGVTYLGTGWTMPVTQQVSRQLNAIDTPHDIGLFLAADQEGGQIQRLNGAGFDTIPSATIQGTWSSDQITSEAAGWAEELAQAGVNLNYAPVADTVPADLVTKNEPIGELNRYFSTDPVFNGEASAAFIEGMRQGGIASCVKHFPGLGRVTGNTDFTADGTTDNVMRTDDPYIIAFTKAFEAKPAAVMISLATYPLIDPDNVAAFSSIIITDLLRQTIGWDGVAISDSLAAAAVKDIPAGQRVLKFIQAGGDIAIVEAPADAQAGIDAIVQLMASDAAFASQVDDSVRRVLTAKRDAGLI
ncbi:MAG: glycoside hydrolase family 3 [Propionibacteriaceae bacterium]|nr:glycoside hydrolase family 3 [Propionibacteriaceae bacterium]